MRVGLNLTNKLLVSGITSDGNPDGVAPDLARELAKKIKCKYCTNRISLPEEVADMAGKDLWNIGMIGYESERAKLIKFSRSRVEIHATYSVSDESSFMNVADIDQSHVRVAVSSRSAYGLYLPRKKKRHPQSYKRVSRRGISFQK